MSRPTSPFVLVGPGDLLRPADEDPVDLARAVARARAALQGHRSRCCRRGVDCRACDIYEKALHDSIRRLNAVLPHEHERAA